MTVSANDSHEYPIYNARFRVRFPILDADGDLVTGAAGLDSELSQDSGTFADATNEATEIATSSGIYYLDLIATETDTKSTDIIVKTSTSGAKTTVLTLSPRRLPVVRTGTAQAGANSTITLDAGASAPDDYYNGCFVNITNNSPSNALGQARKITDYVGSTKVATIEGTWGTNPSSASTFEILLTPEACSAVALAGTPVAATTAGLADVNLVAAAANSITAAAIADGAIDAATFAAGAINAAAIATDAITAAKIAADAIGASELAADAVAEIQSGLATAAALDTIDNFLDTEIADIKGKTDNLPSDPADQSLIISATDAIMSRLGAPAGASVSADILTIDNLVDDLESRLGTPSNLGGGATVSANLADIEAQTDDIGTAGAGLTAVPWNSAWDAEVQSEATDALNAYDPPTNTEMEARTLAAASYATAAALDTVDNFIDTEVAAIKAVTDALPNAGALTGIQADLDDIQTRLPAALISGRMSSDAVAISGDANAGTALKRAVLGNVIGTVGSASTTTSVVTSSLTPAAAVTDQFKGRILTFDRDTATANLRGQATDITASTAAGVLTVTALTTAPASGDTFTIT